MLKKIEQITPEDIREGGYDVFERLYRYYYSKLSAYALNYTNDKHTAENAVQDIFLALWKNRKRTVITTSIKSYLYRMVYNRLIDEYRKNKTRNKKLLDYYYIALQKSIDVDDAYQDKRIKLLNDCIDKLPEKCRITFKEKKFSNKKHLQISKELNVSIKTVEAHMTKAYKLLKECLKLHLTL